MQKQRTVTWIAIVATVLSALVLTGGAAAADGIGHPDDRATRGPGAIEAAQRDVVLRPDDRADRGITTATLVVQPTAGGSFDWADAGVGSAATLGLVLLVAGGSVVLLRHGAQTA